MTDWNIVVWNAIWLQHTPDGLCRNCTRGLVWHMVQVTIWTLQILAFCFFVWIQKGATTLKCCHFCFHVALQCSMSYIHTWSTLVWGSRNLAVWSPNGSGSTFFPRSRYLTLLFAPWPFSLSLYHLPDISLVFDKIQKSIKTEKEGEEKVKKPRFPSILGPQRRPSRIEAASGELGHLNKPKWWHYF